MTAHTENSMTWHLVPTLKTFFLSGFQGWRLSTWGDLSIFAGPKFYGVGKVMFLLLFGPKGVIYIMLEDLKMYYSIFNKIESIFPRYKSLKFDP